MNDLRKTLQNIFENDFKLHVDLANVFSLIVIIIIVFLVSLVLVKMANFTVKSIVVKRDSSSRTITLVKHLQSIIKYVIYFVVIMIVLSEIGINIAPIIASAGVLGLAIGFGAQSIVKDFISGFFMIIENHFTLGDVVEIDSFKGEVIEFGLRSTKIMNWKGEVKIISNGDISSLINYSKKYSVGLVDVSVAYESDLTYVEKVINDFILNYEVTEDFIDKPTYLGVTELADSGINVRLMFKAKPNKHFPLERLIRKEIVDLFKENNIEIPFPQVVVHTHENRN